MYWGLDYPPLTAYVSYVFGQLALSLEPEMVTLTSSRGYETASSKVWMRTSVIVCDLLLYMPATVYFLTSWLRKSSSPRSSCHWNHFLSCLLLLLCQPALVLIDHGHFQYNGVCLGFTILAIALLLNEKELWGSVAFCCALNFKQMALYYAPAFTCYLLSRCMYDHRASFWILFLKLATTVLGTFMILWSPFCWTSESTRTCSESIFQSK